MILYYSIPFIAFWFANITGIPQKFKRALKKERFRPFDCSKCLSFWLAFTHEYYFGFSINSLYYIPLCSLAGWVLQVICNKLNILINQ